MTAFEPWLGAPSPSEVPIVANGRTLGRLAFVALFVCATPLSAAGQAAIEASDVSTDAAACAVLDGKRGQVWVRAVAARGLEEDAARSALRVLEDSLTVEAAARPDGIAAQYELALVLGIRADMESGGDQVRAAEALDLQTDLVLALDPEHAGAHHLNGRLQAAVMRMNRLKRFVATRILGGERLRDASWDDARVRLEAAVAGDPCVPDHHYELARLYSERDEPELAVRQLERLFAVTESRELFADVLLKGRELADELGRD